MKYAICGKTRKGDIVEPPNEKQYPIDHIGDCAYCRITGFMYRYSNAADDTKCYWCLAEFLSAKEQHKSGHATKLIDDHIIKLQWRSDRLIALATDKLNDLAVFQKTHSRAATEKEIDLTFTLLSTAQEVFVELFELRSMTPHQIAIMKKRDELFWTLVNITKKNKPKETTHHETL